MDKELTIAVAGGGIVGVACAYRLSQVYPEARIHVFEKEPELALHQTGRNSGVIHSGIYYAPGTLKAQNCLRGRTLMESFCSEQGLPWERCGKVIVATRNDELPRLSTLHERGLAHGLGVTLLTPGGLRELEPHCRGIAALWVPETGIVHYKAVTDRLGALCRSVGVEFHFGCRLSRFQRTSTGWLLGTDRESWNVDTWINCAGLYSDKVAKQAGSASEASIVPFRGEYFELAPEARHLCKNLIYPVPDPLFPFLGVHFTRAVDGSVEAGPNAVLALGRENYTKFAVNWRETYETLKDRGFQRLALRFWKTGLAEMARSFSKKLFHRELQRLIPEVRLGHLHPAPAGIRAQAIRPDGRLVDDFLIQAERGVVHVVNAPSPAATSSLSIAEQVVGYVVDALKSRLA